MIESSSTLFFFLIYIYIYIYTLVIFRPESPSHTTVLSLLICCLWFGHNNTNRMGAHALPLPKKRIYDYKDIGWRLSPALTHGAAGTSCRVIIMNGITNKNNPRRPSIGESQLWNIGRGFSKNKKQNIRFIIGWCRRASRRKHAIHSRPNSTVTAEGEISTILHGNVINRFRCL